MYSGVNANTEVTNCVSLLGKVQSATPRNKITGTKPAPLTNAGRQHRRIKTAPTSKVQYGTHQRRRSYAWPSCCINHTMLLADGPRGMLPFLALYFIFNFHTCCCFADIVGAAPD